MTGKKTLLKRTAAVLAIALGSWAVVFLVRHQKKFVHPVVRYLADRKSPPVLTFGVIIVAALCLTALSRSKPGLIRRIVDAAVIRNKVVQYIAAVVVFAALLVLRHPPAVFHPYVWVEDGSVNTPHYLRYGLLSVLIPVNGYMIIMPKLLNAVALKLTFLYYPEVSTVLGVAFDIAVLTAVWKAPTVLRAKFFCALTVLLIPHGSEVYILPVYAGWWSGLLVALALLWEPGANNRRQTLTRAAFILAGGLSCPIIILTGPLFALRALMQRTLREWCFAALACGLAVGQVLVVFFTIGNGRTLNSVKSSMGASGGVPMMVMKYLSWGFFYRSMVPLWLMMLVLLAVVWLGWRVRARLSPLFYMLGPMYLLAVASSICRAPLWRVDPILAGPRYFFYPYTFLWWMIAGLVAVQLAEWMEESRGPAPRAWLTFACVAVCVMLLCSGIVFSAQKFVRWSATDRLDWRKSIATAEFATQPVNIPIMYDGGLETFYHLRLAPGDYQRLTQGSILDRFLAKKP